MLPVSGLEQSLRFVCSLTKANVLVFDLSHQSVAFHGSLSEFLVFLAAKMVYVDGRAGWEEVLQQEAGPNGWPTGWLDSACFTSSLALG